MKIRKHLKFYGRVQGVGFRFKSYHLADMLGLTGYVQNEYDGTVEMEVQGEERTIIDFLDKLADDRYIEIDDIRQWKMELVEERGFSMRN